MADLRKLKDKAAELASRGRLEKAADVYREVLQADPRDVATRQRLAEVLRRAGEVAQAVEVYGQVAERFARDGLLIKAVAICKTILELDPSHGTTQRMLAGLYGRKVAADGARPPPRTTFLRAVAPIASEPPEPEVERGVAIPLGPAPAARPAAPLPEVPEPSDTAFLRIMSAAGQAIDAGVEEDFVIEEEVSDDFAPVTPDPELVAPVEAEPPGVEAGSPEVAVEIEPEAPAPTPPPRPAATPAARPEPPAAPLAHPLPRVALFSDLGQDAFVALTEGMVLHRHAAGEPVLREGEASTSFYVVASGRFAVSKRDEAGDPVVLAHLGEGDFFGEMALLSGAPRAATVTAEGPGEVLEIPAAVLQAIAARHPHLAASLRKFYRQRLLANAMAVSPVFRPFGTAERKQIMGRFRAREVAAGEVIIREGEPSDGLYVILDGTVDVLKRKRAEEVLAGRLAEGDLFGEVSCLRKTGATATVRARRGGTLLRLPRPDFDELVMAYPQILELVSTLSDERLEALDAILTGAAQFTEDGLVLI